MVASDSTSSKIFKLVHDLFQLNTLLFTSFFALYFGDDGGDFKINGLDFE